MVFKCYSHVKLSFLARSWPKTMIFTQSNSYQQRNVNQVVNGFFLYEFVREELQEAVPCLQTIIYAYGVEI